MTKSLAFRKIEEIIAARNLSLLGSAPGDYPSSQFPKNELLVCINASSLGIGGEKITPDITVINTAVANSPNAGKPTRSRLNELSTKLLVILESACPANQAEVVFRPIERDHTVVISMDERCDFLEQFLERKLTGRAGGQHVPSTGFFSCLLLLACGAKMIKTLGLSFGDGHSYLEETYKREHCHRDLEVFEWLQANAHPVLFSPELIDAAKHFSANRPFIS